MEAKTIITSTSDSPPVAIKDASGTSVPLSSILPSSRPNPSPRRMAKKSVSFHEDTKPPSEESPTIIGDQDPTAPSVRQEYAFILLDYFMVLVPLASVHTVLDVLVYRQYGQDLVFGDLARRAAIAFGVLFVLHAAVHPSHSGGFMQMTLMLFAILVGSYLVHSAEMNDYFAVMKQAPALGTLLVWFAIELEYYWSILAGVTVGFVAWCVHI